MRAAWCPRGLFPAGSESPWREGATLCVVLHGRMRAILIVGIPIIIIVNTTINLVSPLPGRGREVTWVPLKVSAFVVR